MTPFRSPGVWSATILCGLTVGCQIYLAGGPGGTASVDDGTRQSAAPRPDALRPVPAPMAPAASTPAAPASTSTAPAPAGAVAASAGPATFPGERYYRAGQTRIVLEAVEDALTTRDFRILQSGLSPRGGEVHAERRERITSPPRTSTDAAWQVHAAVIRIAGSTWEDCCYVKAAFTTTRLNSRGDVLGSTTADEPENHVLRTWLFDDVAARIPVPPSY